MTSVRELVERLRLLQAWSGMSYRAVHREVVRARAARGVPERPVLNTIYRCFQPDRARLDVDLVTDVARALLGQDAGAEQWRQACWVVAGLGSAAAIVSVADSWPADLPSFVGRRAELATIAGLAEADRADPAILSITGMPGIGKTRLAVHAGHKLMARGRFARVRLAVDLRGYDPDRPPADPGAVLEGFLRRLGLPAEQIQHLDLAGRVAKYRQLLAGRDALVLLDNAASADQVRPLLPDGPGCCALITSRRALPELTAARQLPLDVLTLAEATTLLRRAGAPVDAEPELTARIAALVGYLPLALALVTARIKANPDWTLTDHFERLLHHQQSLRVDSGVEVAINLSYRDLTGDQQRAFRLLALHPGTEISPDAAAALIGTDEPAARRQLDQLSAASLVQRPGPDRFRFHNLINTFATARAHDEDPARSRRAGLARLANHYLYLAGRAVDAIYPHDRHGRPRIPAPPTAPDDPPDPAAARGWLNTERANLLAVATHPELPGPAAVAFSATLHRHLAMTCQYPDATLLHEHAIGAARRSADRAGEAGALVSLGDLYQRTGHYEQAVDHLSTGLAIARDLSDVDIEGRALFHLGFICLLSGRYERGAEYNRAALACMRATGNRFGEARALGNLGCAYQMTGQLDLAADHLRQTLALCRDLDDQEGEARVLDDLGTIYRLTGRPERAAEHHSAALELLREVGDREGEACALDNLGLVCQENGRLDRAAEHHRAALAISRDIGDRDDEARALNNLGTVCRRSGRYAQAEEHHRTALRLSTELGDPGGQAKALNGLGELALATGDLAQALRAHADAHQYASKIGHRQEQARADDGLGHAHHGLGNHEQAREHWTRALGVYEEFGFPEADGIRARLATR
ncbi:MAG TPA: tetratricopeptide repeat protein [Actinophytocola sp.]|uniref:ATP-binding protein n=1 Tax=Actinophytocola sp. TaxID=1872138 RepID=UPI002DBE7694|nr:tetratricopeptide repeat protein [Actinophytocola sp.]HEU5473392.1 tetratricopeptide repeat protein [Actinophytocola sp.]